MKPFKRLLIANRGEIALRILKTAERMGLEPVVMYSDADKASLAVEMASERVRLGPSPVGESYLNQDLILKLAHAVGAEAIHPGYGFLSEDAGFARRVIEAGLIWVGPSPESMDKVASKSRAKTVAQAAGVPVLPGHQGSQDLKVFIEEANKMNYPVLLKAAAGGGGRGIRKVESDQELTHQFPMAAAEALNNFGSGELILEKYVPEAHHVEVQVFGDHHGQVVHMGERDCSAQRRHQKLVEETPSPSIDSTQRSAIHASAVALAKHAGYSNAGTCEFLVTPSGDYYFLEMNTRLQVEHTVTEMVTGLDLVEWQLRVAMGEKLPLLQDRITFFGHAIQTRLYAEDPYDDYRPQTGRIEGFFFDPAARVDHFLTHQTAITPFYDCMLAKIIVHASDRQTSIEKSIAALDSTVVAGLKTNQWQLRQILDSDFFRAGRTTTRTLEQITYIKPELQNLKEALELAAQLLNPVGQGWSNGLSISQKTAALFLNGTTHMVTLNHEVGAFLKDYPHVVTREWVEFNWKGSTVRVWNSLYRDSRVEKELDPNVVLSPMAGTVVKVHSKAGDKVDADQVLAIVEAMKMQIELKAPRTGVIESVLVTPDTQVRSKQILFQLKGE